RMRGDRPLAPGPESGEKPFTPHARGSTHNREDDGPGGRVYPACAGIDPSARYLSATISSLPRMRGDRPDFNDTIFFILVFTPHARGSTYIFPRTLSGGKVYPACAGIDP